MEDGLDDLLEPHRRVSLIHRGRNLLAKVPEHAQAEVKATYWAIFDTDQLTEGETARQPGPELVAAVQARIDGFAKTYQAAYPAAVKCLLTDREH